jgi:hypothetical protein
MSFQNLFIPHKRSAVEAKWLKQEIKEQEARYVGIVQAMEEMTPTRDKWYAEFLERIQTRGFNTDGDARTKIKLADIPVKPDRPHKVVY